MYVTVNCLTPAGNVGFAAEQQCCCFATVSYSDLLAALLLGNYSRLADMLCHPAEINRKRLLLRNALRAPASAHKATCVRQTAASRRCSAREGDTQTVSHFALPYSALFRLAFMLSRGRVVQCARVLGLDRSTAEMQWPAQYRMRTHGLVLPRISGHPARLGIWRRMSSRRAPRFSIDDRDWDRGARYLQGPHWRARLERRRQFVAQHPSYVRWYMIASFPCGVP